MQKSEWMILILIHSLINLAVVCKNIKPLYGSSGQTQLLYMLFHNLSDGYYVNIGSNKSILNCSATSLYTKGWDGINIQIDYQRYKQNQILKAEDISLNIGFDPQFRVINKTVDRNFLIQDHELNESITKNKSQNIVSSSLIIPSMTLKQVCNIYFQQIPNLLTLNIQKYTINALRSNDWVNPICRPQVVFIKTNEISYPLQLSSSKSLLESSGYKILTNNITQTLILIQLKVYDKYMEIYQVGKKLINQFNLIQLISGFQKIQKRLYPEQLFDKQLNILNSRFYFYFPKENQKIILEKINKLSNKNSIIKNRKILILSYNNENTVFVAQKDSLVLQKYQTQNCFMTRLKVTNRYNQLFEVQILSKLVKIQYIKSFIQQLVQKETVILQNRNNIIQNQKKQKIKMKIQMFKFSISSLSIIVLLIIIMFFIICQRKKPIQIRLDELCQDQYLNKQFYIQSGVQQSNVLQVEKNTQQ